MKTIARRNPAEFVDHIHKAGGIDRVAAKISTSAEHERHIRSLYEDALAQIRQQYAPLRSTRDADGSRPFSDDTRRVAAACAPATPATSPGPATARPRALQGTCAMPGCGEPEESRRAYWCHAHAPETPAADGTTCAVADCPTHASHKGWCRNHHSNWFKTGNPLGSAAGRGTCHIPGCDGDWRRRGLCADHVAKAIAVIEEADDARAVLDAAAKSLTRARKTARHAVKVGASAEGRALGRDAENAIQDILADSRDLRDRAERTTVKAVVDTAAQAAGVAQAATDLLAELRRGVPQRRGLGSAECLHEACIHNVESFGYCPEHARMIARHGHPDGLDATDPALRSLRSIEVSADPLREIAERAGSVRGMFRDGLDGDTIEALESRVRRAIERGSLSMDAADVISIKGLGQHPVHVWGTEWWEVDDLLWPTAPSPATDDAEPFFSLR